MVTSGVVGLVIGVVSGGGATVGISSPTETDRIDRDIRVCSEF